MGKTLFRFFLFSSLILIGCLSSGAKPKWVDTIPSDSGYYIGVGASNSGNKAADYEAALAKAKNNLVSDICLHIEATTTVVANSTINEAKGKQSQVDTLVIQESITQYVEHHLKDLEVVGSYYSKKDGYWVYLRLNKALYELNRRNEMAELATRVYKVLSDKASPIAKQLEGYFSGYEIIKESNYFHEVAGTINGESGLLKDLLEYHISKLISSVRFDATFPTSLIYGDAFSLSLYVKSEIASCDGLSVSVLSSKGAKVATANVKKEEPLLFWIKPTVTDFTHKQNYEAILDLGVRSLLYNSFTIKSALPTSKCSLDLKAPTIKLSLNSSDKLVANKEDGLVGALKACGVAGEFLSSASTYLCSCELAFEVLPTYFENQPTYVKSNLVITLTKDAKKVFAHTFKEIKGAGANQTLATQNCFKALVKEISNSATLQELWNNSFLE